MCVFFLLKLFPGCGNTAAFTDVRPICCQGSLPSSSSLHPSIQPSVPFIQLPLSRSAFDLVQYVPDPHATQVMGVISEGLDYQDNQTPACAESVCHVRGIVLFSAQEMIFSWRAAERRDWSLLCQLGSFFN